MYIIYTIIYIISIIYIYHPGKHYFGIIVGKCRKCADRMGGFSWANAPGRRASRGYLRAPGFWEALGKKQWIWVKYYNDLTATSLE